MNLEYKVFIITMMVSMILSLIISMASLTLSEKSPDKEKVSVYECGFDPFHNPGEPFSMSFFLMAILFLMFDLEMSYLFPWSIGTNIMNFEGQIMIVLFLLILIVGLVYEWMSGGLDWE